MIDEWGHAVNVESKGFVRGRLFLKNSKRAITVFINEEYV